MFHWKDNVFFGRVKDGSVRILAFRSPPESWPNPDGIYDPTDTRYPVCFDKTIDAGSWASIMASVSEGGEENGRYYTALAFHNSVGAVEIDKTLPEVKLTAAEQRWIDDHETAEF